MWHKVHGPFLRTEFLSLFEWQSLWRYTFQGNINQTIWTYKAILSTAVAHTLLCKLDMVTIVNHIFTNIFQMTHISTLKFTEDYEEKYELSFDTKMSESLKKSVELVQAPLICKKMCLVFWGVWVRKHTITYLKWCWVQFSARLNLVKIIHN